MRKRYTMQSTLSIPSLGRQLRWCAHSIVLMCFSLFSCFGLALSVMPRGIKWSRKFSRSGSRDYCEFLHWFHDERSWRLKLSPYDKRKQSIQFMKMLYRKCVAHFMLRQWPLAFERKWKILKILARLLTIKIDRELLDAVMQNIITAHTHAPCWQTMTVIQGI